MNVLNFGDFDGASATANTPVVCKLDEALSHLGFSVVRNIGIEQELIDTAFECSREFFDQPFAHKIGYEYAGPGAEFRLPADSVGTTFAGCPCGPQRSFYDAQSH